MSQTKASDKNQDKVINEIVKKTLRTVIEKNILFTPANYHRVFLKNALNLGLDVKSVQKYAYGIDSFKAEEVSDLKNTVNDVINNVQHLTKQIRKNLDDKNTNEKEIISRISKKSNKNINDIIKELENLLKVNAALRAELDITQQKLQKQKADIESIKEISIKDYLTGVYSRMFMDEKIHDLIYIFRRYNRPFSVVMIDLDNFKKINDTYGHQVGDTVLKGIGHVLLNEIRKTDIPVRYGGDEFVVILSATSIDGAKGFAKRILNKIKNLKFDSRGTTVQCSASAGITSIRKSDDEISILERVDKALYSAKRTKKGDIIIV